MMDAREIQILYDEQETSNVIQHLVGIVQITLADYSGGTWVLQRLSPSIDNENKWIDLDVVFNGEGSQVFYAAPSITYRLTGGDVGATAWIVEIPIRQAGEINPHLNINTHGVPIQ